MLGYSEKMGGGGGSWTRGLSIVLLLAQNVKH